MFCSAHLILSRPLTPSLDDFSPMPDYYGVISRAIAALDEGTVTTRRALYDRARLAQVEQLRKIDPPLAKKDFDRECLALEDAIRRVEQTWAAYVATETKFQDAERITPLASLSSDKAKKSIRKGILSTVSGVVMSGLGIVAMLRLAAIPRLSAQGLRPDGAVIRALRYCFSFSGRFNRTNFWIGYGIAFFMITIAVIAVQTIAPNNNNFLGIVGRLWSILWFLSTLSVATKRLHDLGYSGLLVLVYVAVTTAAEIMLPEYRLYEGFLAVVCVIWLGAAPGEKTPNRFGTGYSVENDDGLQA